MTQVDYLRALKFILFGSLLGAIIGNAMYNSQSAAPAIVKNKEATEEVVELAREGVGYLRRDEIRELSR